MRIRQFRIACLVPMLVLAGCTGSDRKENKEPDAVDKSQLAGEASPSKGGTYSFGKGAETGPVGSLKVFPLNSGNALFFLDVNRGAPSYNLGQRYGEMSIKGDEGTYEADGCVLRFEFGMGSVEVQQDSGTDCGFGANVKADQNYALIDSSIPDFYVKADGDTVKFGKP